MKKYQLRIQLLSDLCVSDGGVYNSSLDIDICHDEYGFPYIPGRRIKGCLRECALELLDWGKDIPIKKIFGGEGDAKGAVSIRNAYLENYDELRKQVEQHRNSLLFHPQNILSHYSYLRTQTAVNKETGTAKDKTLRVMRVAKKDLVFIAELEMDEAYKSMFKDILAVFHSMGISRSRGLGEIKAELIPGDDDSKEDHKGEKSVDMDAVKRKIEKEGCLRYSVCLEEPLICKSIDGGEARSLDYIQGSRILGIVLQEMKRAGESVEKFLQHTQELFFSNAYLEEGEKRLTEVPATYYSIKDNDKKYIDKAYENEENQARTDKWQLNVMKHCYVGEASDGTMIKKSVAMEERYHHRRPEDKSIGRVIEDEKDPGVFYQVSSIAAGQSFQGYVKGTMEQLQDVARYLSKRQYYSIGTSRLAEYGKVTIQLHLDEAKSSTDRAEEAMPADRGMDLLIKLESPAIVYSRENITCSIDVEDLVEEVNAVLGLKSPEEMPDRMDEFMNYTSVGGYNVTWHKRKPTVEAFDKGTVLIYHFEKRPSLSIELKQNRYDSAVIGERNLEGYGEISIIELLPGNGKYEGKLYSPPDKPKTEEKINVKETELAEEISRKMWEEYIRIKARVKTESFGRNKLKKARAVVSNLLSMCDEQKTWMGLKECVDKRFDRNSKRIEEKKDLADDMVKVVEKEMCDMPGEFCAIYKIGDWETDEDESKIAYLRAYLIELRHRIREHENNEGGNPT